MRASVQFPCIIGDRKEGVYIHIYIYICVCIFLVVTRTSTTWEMVSHPILACLITDLQVSRLVAFSLGCIVCMPTTITCMNSYKLHSCPLAKAWHMFTSMYIHIYIYIYMYIHLMYVSRSGGKFTAPILPLFCFISLCWHEFLCAVPKSNDKIIATILPWVCILNL